MHMLDALEFIDSRLGLISEKTDLQAKITTMLRLQRNGGIFVVDRELICFVDLLINRGHRSAVLIDSLGNPIEIPDLESFNDGCLNLYFEAANLYHCEYTRLCKLKKEMPVNEFSGSQ